MVFKAEKKPVNCTLIGDAMIGKSTLVKAFMNQHRPETNYVATVLETYEGSLDLDGQKQNVSILDNAGQHDYENMRSCSYKDSDVLVLCYSVADRDSLESVKDFWVPEMNNCSRRKKPVILVATQSDLRSSETDKCVSSEEGQTLANEIGAETFIECSAFDNDSVTKVFETMTTSGLQYRKKKSSLVSRIFGK